MYFASLNTLLGLQIIIEMFICKIIYHNYFKNMESNVQFIKYRKSNMFANVKEVFLIIRMS